MRTLDTTGSTVSHRPRDRSPGQAYRPLRDDPRYDEIKKMIEELPPEKLEALKSYIQRWLRPS